jgi:aminoglycoside 6'-N-acetyltransferase
VLDVKFYSLLPTHFELMFRWLEAPHVKKWWDQDISYTLDLVREKYESYTQGYKSVDGIKKPIDAYIINFDDQPIGYIQL